MSKLISALLLSAPICLHMSLIQPLPLSDLALESSSSYLVFSLHFFYSATIILFFSFIVKWIDKSFQLTDKVSTLQMDANILLI